MSIAEKLFDYRDKSSEWIRRIYQNYTETVRLNGSIPVYVKIVASAKAELERRGEPV